MVVCLALLQARLPHRLPSALIDFRRDGDGLLCLFPLLLLLLAGSCLILQGCSLEH